MTISTRTVRRFLNILHSGSISEPSERDGSLRWQK